MNDWKRNWELKLLALVMAVLVWLFVHLKQDQSSPGGTVVPTRVPSEDVTP